MPKISMKKNQYSGFKNIKCAASRQFFNAGNY